jgi:nitrogen regulatory protein PII 2
MKTIIAILRIHTMNQTKIALSEADIPSFTATGQVMEGVRNNQPEAIALLGPEPRLRLHRLLTLTVPDSKVKIAVQAIMDANRTDAPGDGKIFVLPTTEALSIRTGESGDSVLD